MMQLPDEIHHIQVYERRIPMMGREQDILQFIVWLVISILCTVMTACFTALLVIWITENLETTVLLLFGAWIIRFAWEQKRME